MWTQQLLWLLLNPPSTQTGFIATTAAVKAWGLEFRFPRAHVSTEEECWSAYNTTEEDRSWLARVAISASSGFKWETPPQWIRIQEWFQQVQTSTYMCKQTCVHSCAHPHNQKRKHYKYDCMYAIFHPSLNIYMYIVYIYIYNVYIPTHIFICWISQSKGIAGSVYTESIGFQMRHMS